MKAVLCTLGLLTIALVGVGCKKTPSLVGKWNVTVKDLNGVFDFQPEDKMVLSVTTPGGVINLVGECKLKGDEATMTFTDIQVPGQSDANVAMVKKASKSLLNQPQVFQVIFTSNDEVSFAEKIKTPPPAQAPKAGATTAGTPAATTAGAGAASTTPPKAAPVQKAPIPAAMTLKRVKEAA